MHKKNIFLFIKILILFLQTIQIKSYSKIPKKTDNKKYQKIWGKIGLFKSLSMWKYNTEERISIHEAAHFVIAKINNINITNITIKKYSGHTIITKTKDISKLIQIRLAGFLAEKNIFGKASYGCKQDISIATKYIIQLHKLNNANIETIKNVLKNYITQTENIILKNLNLIKKIAKEIQKQKYYDINKQVKIIDQPAINEIYEKLT